MAKCPKLFPIALLPLALALVLPLTLGMPAIAHASAEPVATAVIPPPLADPSATAPSASAPATPRAAKAGTSPAKPSSAGAAESAKRSARHVASPRNEPVKRAAAQKPSQHVKRERHIVVARAYPPPAPARPRYYYPGAPVAGPDNDGPLQWYDRGRPLAGYPYLPPPRGPIPPW